MRKIVTGFAVSLNGFIEGPAGEHDWMQMDKEEARDNAESVRRYDAFLFGRISYEKLRGFGGTSFQGITNYVYSSSLTEVTPGDVLVKENAPNFIRSLKEQPGKDIALYGGARLLTTLLNEDLVDEIIMSVMPILLPGGKPMVDVLDKRVPLALKEIKQYRNGTVKLAYEVVRK